MKHGISSFGSDVMNTALARMLIVAGKAALLLGVPLVAMADGGLPFVVAGEQIKHAAPAGWKLAWMDGTAEGSYLAEYVPDSEDITSWRSGYLAIARYAYPPAEVKQQIEQSNTTVSAVALHQYMEKAIQSCGGKHHSMARRTNTFNGLRFSVGGGFCERYGPQAPFGEGAFVAFAEGKGYLFRIQYGWRPRSAEDKISLPWRITEQSASQYLEAIKASSLCGGVDQTPCTAVR